MCVACPEGFILNEDYLRCVCPEDKPYLTNKSTCIKCDTMWLVNERYCVECDEDKLWNDTEKSCECKKEKPMLGDDKKCKKCENGTIWS